MSAQDETAGETAAGAPTVDAIRPPSPLAPIDARPARLHLEVETLGGGVSMRGPSESGFTTLCVENCERDLEPGTYQFALRRPDGSLAEWLPPTDLKRNSIVEAAFESRRAARIVGGIILAAGVLTGAVLLGRGLALRSEARDACDWPGGNEGCGKEPSRVGRGRIIAGSLTGIASALLGAILVSRKDTQSLRVSERPSFTNEAAEPREEPALAAGDPDEARAQLRQRAAAVKACLRDTPASAELRVAHDGSITKLDVLGDAEPAQRQCLRLVLLQLSFAAGVPRSFSMDIQPMLQ